LRIDIGVHGSGFSWRGVLKRPLHHRKSKEEERRGRASVRHDLFPHYGLSADVSPTGPVGSDVADSWPRVTDNDVG
jgi:hypothetical protein